MLDDGTPYALPGKLLFSDASVDAVTGQVTLRGEFPNPKRELLPGMYVRVQIEQGVDSDAHRGAAAGGPAQRQRRQRGLRACKNDNRAAVQPVRLGRGDQDGHWLVLDGLKPGDRVVVDGFQKFAAGDSVKSRAPVASRKPSRRARPVRGPKSRTRHSVRLQPARSLGQRRSQDAPAWRSSSTGRSSRGSSRCSSA